MADYVSLQDCLNSPHLYKVCGRSECVPVYQLCPCQPEVEFQCNDGTCVPRQLICDGRRQCPGGEDEYSCGGSVEASKDLSSSTIAAIAASVIFVSLILATLLGVYLYRKLRNTSETSNSAVKQPLQGERSSEETDTSDRAAEDKTLLDNKYHAQSYHQARETSFDGREDQTSDFNSNTQTRTRQEIQKKNAQRNRDEAFQFDKDLILDQFADGLLCTSTPRQPIRHVVQKSPSSGNIGHNKNANNKQTLRSLTFDIT